MKRARVRKATLRHSTDAVPQISDTSYASLKAQLSEFDGTLLAKLRKRIFKGYSVLFRSPCLLMKRPDTKLSTAETEKIVTSAINGTLHREYIDIAGTNYLVTTCKARSIYARNTDTSKKDGLVIIRLKRLFVIAMYTEALPPHVFIPVIELLADMAAATGY